jgi:anti-sigma B factor antagonist
VDATPTPERCAGRAVIPVTGEVDLATAPALRRLIHDALDDPAVHTLVVDLDGVTFIDCAGVSTLLGGRAEASRCRKAYAVVNPRGVVKRVLTLTGAWPTLQRAQRGSRVGRTSPPQTT